MRLSIAIVEDHEADRKLLQQYLRRYEKSHEDIFSIACFHDGLAFISDYKADADIILMDIEMPHLDGMETARRLREIDDEASLLFITNMAQYAIKGYAVRALDFMVKPVEYGEFELKLERAIRNRRRNMETTVMIENAGVARRVRLRDIQYIEVYNHSLIYHTVSGDFEVHGQLKALEADTRFSAFSKCNSCYLVNCEYVTEIRGDYVVVGNTQLPISRRRKKLFMEQLANYMGGGL